MKKFALILILLLSLAAFISCGSSEPSDTEFSYTEVEGGYEIRSVSVIADTIRIPDSYNGKPVVSIAASAFYKCNDLEKVTISASVQNIKDGAFADCKELRTVIFSEGGSCVLADSVFENCSMLKSVECNGSVISVGDFAFKNCNRLSAFDADKELTHIGFDAFSGCDRLWIKASHDTEIYKYAVQNHIATQFTDTVYFTYLEIVIISVVAIVVIVAYRITKKKKAKKDT